MLVKYKIDGSSELRSIEVPEGCTDGNLCAHILHHLFGDNPTCNLTLRDREDDVVLLSRTYVKKFEAIPKLEVLKPKRRKRWVSRSPPRKRWVSRSPERRNRRY